MKPTQITLLTAGIACLITAIVGGGQTILGISFPLLASTKRQVLLGLVGVLFILVSLQPLFPPFPPGPNPSIQSSEAKHFAALTRWKQDKGYVIEAVTMYVNIDDSPTERHSGIRMIYAIRALRDIKSNESLFPETFGSTGMITHWPGTQPEDFSAQRGKSNFIVNFDLPKDGLLAFETGQDSVIPLPMPAGRPSFIKRETLEVNTDDYFYSVDKPDDDIVHTLTMVITSRTTSIRVIKAVLYRTDKDAQDRIDSSVRESDGWRTISATWSFLEPNQRAGIIVGW